jgi:hypothetical protein
MSDAIDSARREEPGTLSPIAPNERWFYTRNGEKSGPVDTDALCELIQSGNLLLTDQVWRHGMSQWLAVSEVESLIPPHVIVNAKMSSTQGRGRWSRRGIAIGALFPLALLTSWAWMPRGRLTYQRVSGTVTYPDGAPLPVDGMIVQFHSLVRARDAQRRPPKGVAVVDRESGGFSYATTRFPGDGILTGIHKVTLHTADEQPLPESVANADYSDLNRTVLRVDTKDKPFKIVVNKP